jgi:HSP20 family protein
MALVKWDPMAEMVSLRRQMDRLMESVWGEEPFWAREKKWVPAFDLIEGKDEIIVQVDIPGMDEKDLSVSLSGDNLIIKGERKEEKEEKDKHYHRKERRHGSFQRIVTLPVTVDAKKISAEYHNGVLKVHLPKKEEVKPKEIPISTVKKVVPKK